MRTGDLFAIFPTIALFVYVATVVVAMVAFIRRNPRSLAPPLAVILSMATAWFHLPLWFVRTPRMDRLRGQVDEPVRTLQTLVVAVELTLVLCVLFVAITRMRRTDGVTRAAALVTVVIVNAGLLNLFWLVLIVPIGDDWRPVEWDRPDLLIPVRPCRGAVVWAYAARNYMDIGTVDEIWLQFADPRNGRAPAFAVSMSGRWRANYFWLNSSDLHDMRVRKDDPAVVDCDSRPRPERVAPAAWHELGFAW